MDAYLLGSDEQAFFHFSARGATAMIRYVDISSYQGDPEQIDWAAYAAWSTLIAIKCSEGNGVVDANYAAYTRLARSHGLFTIAYHFARPDLGNTAMDEANFCLQQCVVDGHRPDLIMLDVEVLVDDLAAWTLACLEELDTHFSTPPWLYANLSTIVTHLQLAGLAWYPLVLAAWTQQLPSAPLPWTRLEAWQYTDHATVPGFPGGVDADLLEGDLPMTLYLFDQNSPTFGDYFTSSPDGQVWTCKQNGHVVQYGIRGFYQTLAYVKDALPLVGLPVTNEVYLNSATVLQGFERAWIYYDLTGGTSHQPGLGRAWLAQLTDGNVVSRLNLPTAPGIPEKLITDLRTLDADAGIALTDGND
jgi:GH25 family lysozyme M1 (1,4-beta-N-acetylmuramidase)